MKPLAQLLRGMNSYYTNKIEGQHTLPSQLESALKKQFSPDADVQRKQRMAMAHMDAELWAETAYAGADWRDLFSPDVVCALHTQITRCSQEHFAHAKSVWATMKRPPQAACPCLCIAFQRFTKQRGWAS
jgi:Fic family protein